MNLSKNSHKKNEQGGENDESAIAVDQDHSTLVELQPSLSTPSMPILHFPSLGILRLDYKYPAIPGDIDCQETFTDYPVYYRVVPGLTFEMCQSGRLTSEVERDFDQAVKYLVEEKNVSAITGDCGFMMWFQERARQLTRKPVLLSPLTQLPSITSAFDRSVQILIVSANAKTLYPMHDLIVQECGVDPFDNRFVIIGCEDVPHFGEPVCKGLQVDTVKAQPGILKHIEEALKEHPNVCAILMECTEMPVFSNAVRRTTGLPVFDAVTNVDHCMSSRIGTENFGLQDMYPAWNGCQESYYFGKCLKKQSELMRLVHEVNKSIASSRKSSIFSSIGKATFDAKNTMQNPTGAMLEEEPFRSSLSAIDEADFEDEEQLKQVVEQLQEIFYYRARYE